MEPNSSLEPLGERIRRLRQAKGLPQERLALLAKVDQSGLSKFERGGRGLGRVPLTRIASVLGVTLADLLQGSDYED
jgi:transcriptional regulator with XRE-family HTH domain